MRSLVPLAWRVGLPAVLCTGTATAYAADTDNPVFRAGAAQVDITPTKFPVIVNGMFTERMGHKAQDRLMSRALILDDGATCLAIVVVDSLMILRKELDQAKELAQKRTGIPAARMLISATHTHSAPSCMGCLGSRADPAYTRSLPGLIAQSIVEANAARVPARIGWAAVQDHDHNHTRRWIFLPDRMATDPFGERTIRAHMHPGHQSRNHIGPSGPDDPDMSVLSVQQTDGRTLAVLANYSMHYYGSALVSGDVCGRFGARFAALLGDKAVPQFVGMLSQGTSGDSTWIDYSKPRRSPGLDGYADALARSAMRAYETIHHRDHVSLAMAEATLSLRRRTPDADRLAWARAIATKLGNHLPRSKAEIYAKEAIFLHEEPEVEIKLQAIRIGELGITALPNEVYGITGLKLKAQSPLTPTFNIELANGAQGYIPPPEQHVLGGYTTWPARTAGLEVQAEPRIVEQLLQLLEKVSDKPRRPLADPATSYAKAVLDAKPAAFWRLGEMNGPRAADAAGNRHGTYEDGVAFYLPGPAGDGLASGPRGNRAAHFAGGRMLARAGNPGASYTVEFWFWNGLPNDAREITAHLFALNGDGLDIGGTQDGASGRLIFRAGDGGAATLQGSTEIRPKTWHHVAVARDGDAVAVYLNGEGQPEIKGVLPRAASTSQSTTARVFVGGCRDQTFGLEGKLDEFALYGRALNAREVSAHFKASGYVAPPKPRPPSETASKPSAAADLERYAKAVAASKPLAWWTLHQAAGERVPDAAGKHDGQLEKGAAIHKPGAQTRNFSGGRMRAATPNLGDTYSVELWLWNDLPNRARPVTGYVVSRGANGANGAPGDHLGIGGTHVAPGKLIVFNGNRRNEVLTGVTEIPPRTWNHVLMVRAGKKIRVYLNGAVKPEVEGDLAITYAAGNADLFIGGRNDNFANFRGRIDQVAVYRRALPPEEFAAHFKASGLSLQKQGGAAKTGPPTLWTCAQGPIPGRFRGL